MLLNSYFKNFNKYNTQVRFNSLQNNIISESQMHEMTEVIPKFKDGKILTPEEYTTVSDLWGYTRSLEKCEYYHKLVNFLHVDEVKELHAAEIKAKVWTHMAGDLCPEINPTFGPTECLHFHAYLKELQYFHQCVDFVCPPSDAKEVYLYDRFLQAKIHASDLLTSLATDSSIFSVSSYVDSSLWFFVNKPLLEEEYFQVRLFLGISILLACLIIAASFLLVIQKPESEKLSTYECGFEPYEDAKNKFDVQFYIVAILFVLFDIEIIIMLPWCLSLSTVNLLGYWSMIEFLLELGLGFVYVWGVGALDW